LPLFTGALAGGKSDALASLWAKTIEHGEAATRTHLLQEFGNGGIGLGRKQVRSGDRIQVAQFIEQADLILHGESFRGAAMLPEARRCGYVSMHRCEAGESAFRRKGIHALVPSWGRCCLARCAKSIAAEAASYDGRKRLTLH